MITELMVQPSYWIDSDISIQKVRNLYLFKFTENLQARLEELAEGKKANILVRSRASFLCEYCHSAEESSSTLFTIDHILPRSKRASD